MEIRLTAESEAQKGLAAYRAKEYPKAIQAFKAAIEGYTAAGEPLNAAEIANNLSVTYLQSGNAKAALDAARETDQVFASAGDIKRQAVALGNQAAALENLKQNKLAIEKYQECADLLKEVGDHENRAVVLQSISKLQLEKRQPLDSLFTMRTALENKTHLSLADRILKTLLQIVFRLWGV
jgi:tetratricopeptide (TPR) repeat protein